MSKTIKLEINSNIRPIKNIDSIKPIEIRKKLLSKGYEDLNLLGIPIEKCNSGVHLWVEQDVDFLIESCQDLEELILKQDEFEHYSFLNDGLLTIKASVNKEVAQVLYRYCPGLNKDKLISKTKQLSKEEYIWQWRNIAYDLLDISEK